MSKWDEYQNFSTTAKEYGGANAYLDFLEDNARGEGRTEGGIIGVIATLAAGAVVAVGIWGFNKAKCRFIKRKQEKQLAPIVRQEFLSNVEQYEKDNGIDSTENN